MDWASTAIGFNNLVTDDGGVADSVALGAGTYEIMLVAEQFRIGYTDMYAGFNYASSLSFTDGAGGAVPGLGALAPLAAAGLARRRRR